MDQFQRPLDLGQRCAGELRDLFQWDGEIARLFQRLGDDPGKVADIARGTVKLPGQIFGERCRGILNTVEIKSFIAGRFGWRSFCRSWAGCS